LRFVVLLFLAFLAIISLLQYQRYKLGCSYIGFTITYE